MTAPLDEKGWEATMSRIRDYTMDAEAKKWWLRFCEAQQDLHAAEARIKALEEALTHLAECNLSNPHDFRQFARSALKENAL